MKLPIDIQGTLSDEAVYDVKQIKAMIESVKSAREKLNTPQKEETQNKKYWEKQKKEATEALEAINSTQKRLLDAGKFEGIDAEIVANYKKHWKSHSTLTPLAKQDLPTFGYNMIDPLKPWCWGSILFYPFRISRFS